MFGGGQNKEWWWCMPCKEVLPVEKDRAPRAKCVECVKIFLELLLVITHPYPDGGVMVGQVHPLPLSGSHLVSLGGGSRNSNSWRGLARRQLSLEEPNQAVEGGA